MIKDEKSELQREFWKNEKRLNGRKLSKMEKVQLIRRNKEIMEKFLKRG